jgi:hypothetical protein
MGKLFKVMLATKKNVYFNVGFENWLNLKNFLNLKQ